jgi:hypothetical protein
MADKRGKLSPEDIGALLPKVMAAADSTLDARERAAGCSRFRQNVWRPLATSFYKRAFA